MIAIYVRQSLDKKDSLSIQAQIEDCINLCKRNGWNDYKVYEDKGWSAKNLERPNFQKMNNDVKSGQIEAVVCYKIDRISRSIRDLVNLIEDYHELGVHFVSFADNINTGAPGGLMMATLFGSLAQMEREAIITRVTDNYYFRCELGYWGGGPAPYGFHLKKIQENGQKHTVLEVEESEAAVVRQFFDWYLEPDGSVNSILTKSKQKNITTRNGSLWTSRVVSDLLSKPLYAPNNMDIYNFYVNQGVKVRITPEQCDGSQSINVFGKRDRHSKHPKRSRPVEEMTLAIAKHQSIIPSDIFLRVQDKKRTKLSVAPRSGTGKSTILTGLVKCGYCGRAMSPSGSRNHVKYFTCSGKRNYASGTCQSSSVKVETLEHIVLADLLNHIQTSPAVQNLIQQSHIEVPASDSAAINLLQQEIGKLNVEIENLLAACAGGNNIAIKYLNDKIEKLDAKKKSLNRQIDEIRQKTDAICHAFDLVNLDSLETDLKHGTFDTKKIICQAFIEKVIVQDKNDFEIIFAI